MQNIRLKLAQIANELDGQGLYNEANEVDGVLQQLSDEYNPEITPETIFQMPNSAEILSKARDWVLDVQWVEDEETIEGYSDFQILNGIKNHYSGGLESFLRDSGFIQ